jgi:hypothetical protein
MHLRAFPTTFNKRDRLLLLLLPRLRPNLPPEPPTIPLSTFLILLPSKVEAPAVVLVEVLPLPQPPPVRVDSVI